jgi:hypothetical protein
MTFQQRFDYRFKRYDNITVDIERLKQEAHLLLWQEEHKRYKDQLSLQTDGTANWAAGTGSKEGVEESIWDKLHPDLVGTWWEEFFAVLPVKVYRARLLTIQPRTCYSIHVDRTPRIHIAIDTHPQARFIFTTPPQLRYIPADGGVWWVDTTKEHSAMNGSLKPRIHLVACLDNTDPD